jgi:hypothetical protein
MADRTESSIVIEAPPGTVLDVIADFAADGKFDGLSNCFVRASFVPASIPEVHEPSAFCHRPKA